MFTGFHFFLFSWSLLWDTQFCVSRKGGTGGGGQGHPQGAVCMAATRLGCKRTLVGTRWANSHPGCTSRFRKHYSQLLGGSFLGSKQVFAN